MKTLKLKTILLVMFTQCLFGQTKIQVNTEKNKFPDTFIIREFELNDLFKFNLNDKVIVKSNDYLDQATVVYKYENDKVHQLKLKLNYFKDAFLVVQINADESRQLFILSDSTTANYKNKLYQKTDKILMEKCKKEEIVSE